MLGGSISGGSALDDKYEDRCEERLNVIHILEGLEGFDSKTDWLSIGANFRFWVRGNLSRNFR